jgi:hypothetical protein
MSCPYFQFWAQFTGGFQKSPARLLFLQDEKYEKRRILRTNEEREREREKPDTWMQE